MAAKKQELTDLRSEETRMEQQLQSTTLQLEKLQTTLQDTQLQISQIKGACVGRHQMLKDFWNLMDLVLHSARVTVLQEHQHQVDEALSAYNEALESGDPTELGDNVLRPIAPVASETDFLPSPSSDRSKVNGGAAHVIKRPLLALSPNESLTLGVGTRFYNPAGW